MNKKSDLKIIIIFSIIGVLLFGFLAFRVYKDFINNPTSNKKLVSLDLYGYTLSKNDTDVYKDTFNELKDVLNADEFNGETGPYVQYMAVRTKSVLEKAGYIPKADEINYEEYAKLISQLFVIDVFTLDNKLASTDIGGLEFLHKDFKENFRENMGSSLYKNVLSNIDGKRNQELPIVSKAIVDNVFETKYTYEEKEYDAYLVTVSIEYEKDLGYQNSIKLTVINDNNILYIVKGEK